MLRMVLLPEPDGPSRATNSPRRTLNETSRTASIAVPASWKDLLNALTSMRRTSGNPGNGVADMPCAFKSSRSSRIGFSSIFDKGRTHHFGNGEQLDAGHFPKPDFFAARKTCRIDGGVIVDDFLQGRDFEDVGAARRAADIGLDRLIDLVWRMCLDPLGGSPDRRNERLHLGRVLVDCRLYGEMRRHWNLAADILVPDRLVRSVEQQCSPALLRGLVEQRQGT